LTRYTIDIPPGERNYWIENSYVLPVDVDLLRINPHAHYLGKQLEGWAILPDGSRRDLLLIRNWDFNWQGDYLYKERMPLPKGTTLHMRFSYDNSAENSRNPNQPPKRVRFGLQTTDEMGELWFQVLPRNRNDLALLSQDFFAKLLRDNMEAYTARLQTDPQDATAHTKLASALLTLNRLDEAVQHLHTAIGLDPTNPIPHSQLGSIYLRQEQLPQAQAEFEAVLRADPQDYEAQGRLGLIAMRQRRFSEAEAYFEKALKINPEDQVAQRCLDALRNSNANSPQSPPGL
jgi:tetratricopeptide (TPR) repeat protein